MLELIIQKLNPKNWRLLKRQKGQSLVEMAIATPILLIMLIGVFEVGWALRGYIVLANVNRESVRFGVKNGVLDYSIKNPATVGYNTVLSHTTAALASQLPLEFLNNPNSTIIMSHIVADTGFPCAKYQGSNLKVPYEFDAASCDCTEDDPDAAQWFTRDDLVLHPDLPGYDYYAQTYGLPRTTRLGGGSYAELAAEVALANNQFNCNVLKTGSGGEMSINNMFITEVFYDQPQLFGLPFVSNRLTDPIPFYAHTAMRIVTSREADTNDTIGPTCELFPITFPSEMFSDQGYDPDNPPSNIPIDAFESRDPGNFGWLTWNPDPSHNNAPYIWEELTNLRLSMTDYTDPTDANDHSLNLEGWISSGPGVVASAEDFLQTHVGRTVYVPVHGATTGSGQNVNYQITHFARITINEICLPNSVCSRGDYSGSQDGKLIRATFLEYVDDVCTDTGGTGGGGGAGNHDPVAVDKTLSTPKNTPIDIPATTAVYATDEDGDNLTVHSVTQESNPFKGTLAISPDNTTITYTPKSNDTGTYTFYYAIIDGNGGSDTGLITIIVGSGVNSAPTALDDTYSTPGNTALTIDAASGLLANDTDPEDDIMTAAKTSDPAHGTVSLNPDGSFTYTPTAGFSGTDTFTYKASDDSLDSNEATVTIDVQGNAIPVADNDSYTTTEETPLTVNAPGVLTNDTDADGDSLTAIKVTNPANGTVTFNANGSFTYTPNANFDLTDSFTYKVNDGADDSAAPATVSIIVNPVNDAPVAANDSYTTPYNTALSGNVLDNDTDETVVLTAIKLTDPNPANGTLTWNSDGSFTYTPTSGFSGSVSFTYKANDSALDSNVATVNITVNAPQLVTVASDNFSSGWPASGSGWSNNWSINGSVDIDSGTMRMRNTGEGTRTVNMTGVTGVEQLVYQWRANSFDNSSENAVVQISNNGGTSWQTVQTISDGQDDNNWHQNTVNLTGYSIVNNFQVRFKINGSGTNDYFYIDDITITGYR